MIQTVELRLVARRRAKTMEDSADALVEACHVCEHSGLEFLSFEDQSQDQSQEQSQDQSQSDLNLRRNQQKENRECTV